MINVENTIYADYNATSPLNPLVKEAMLEVMGYTYNPSSVHKGGQEAKSIIESARNTIKSALNAGNAKVVFTSSGTEANNLALHGVEENNCIVSAIEHPSVLTPAIRHLNRHILPVDKNGVVDLQALEEIMSLSSGKFLVSVMLANNETGVVQPITEISKIVYKNGGYFHCDAAQGVGKINVDMQDLNVDLLTISSHKFGGPQGAAALIVKNGIDLTPQILGGGQEGAKRAGTENVAAIVGFAKAVELLADNIENFRRVVEVRDFIEEEIIRYEQEGLVVGREVMRLPNTSCIYMPGMKAETQVINFDLEGIAISAGSACSSGKVQESHVLKAMGLSKNIIENTIRISLSPDATIKDGERIIELWKNLHKRSFSKIRCQQRAA